MENQSFAKYTIVMDVTFVTGNQHKADKTAELLGRPLQHKKIHLDEIQTLDITELATHKIKQAFEIVQKPVIIDDYSLGLTAYSGLPGTFVKFYIEANDGLEKLCQTASMLRDRRAATSCVMAFYDGDRLELFERVTLGQIAEHPIGENGIDTDKIFIPNGYTKTRAQMDDEEYNAVYMKVRPLAEMKEFLDGYYD